jgi:hypothetical protein
MILLQKVFWQGYLSAGKRIRSLPRIVFVNEQSVESLKRQNEAPAFNAGTGPNVRDPEG